MNSFQLAFVILVTAVFGYLVFDGIRTGSVWIKGGRDGLINFSEWVHKRSRIEEPFSYWMAMALYSAFFSFCMYMLFFGPYGFQ